MGVAGCCAGGAAGAAAICPSASGAKAEAAASKGKIAENSRRFIGSPYVLSPKFTSYFALTLKAAAKIVINRIVILSDESAAADEESKDLWLFFSLPLSRAPPQSTRGAVW
jgi:hypothetical protein